MRLALMTSDSKLESFEWERFETLLHRRLMINVFDELLFLRLNRNEIQKIEILFVLQFRGLLLVINLAHFWASHLPLCQFSWKKKMVLNGTSWVCKIRIYLPSKWNNRALYVITNGTSERLKLGDWCFNKFTTFSMHVLEHYLVVAFNEKTLFWNVLFALNRFLNGHRPHMDGRSLSQNKSISHPSNNSLHFNTIVYCTVIPI